MAGHTNVTIPAMMLPTASKEEHSSPLSRLWGSGHDRSEH
jgi:hypothetical protein